MQWMLFALAVMLAIVVVPVAYFMIRPIRFDRLAQSGLYALWFPLHLLAITLVAAVMTAISWALDASLAAASFGGLVVLTALMAIVPCLATWRGARALDVPISLAAYLRAARSPNWGGPVAERTITFGVASDGTKLELDVWRAATAAVDAPRPAVVIVHGGGWVGGARSSTPAWNHWLNERGFEVFDISYRLPPPARWSDEVADVRAAVGWLTEHADEFGVDASRITLLGHSAGGNLAMLAAYTADDVGAVRAVVNFYGPADLVLLTETSGSSHYVDTCLRDYIGGSVSEHLDRYRLVSPLTHVTSAAPPTITVIGARDRIIPPDQSRILHDALDAAGVPNESYTLPANDHAFDVNWGGFGTQISRAKIEEFLARHG